MTSPIVLTADEDRLDIQRVLAGDDEAFSALVERHQGRIRAFVRRLVGESDADDLAQETFVRAWSALGRYDPTYPFRGWLLVIAGRLATNHRARRRPQSLGDYEPTVPRSDDDVHAERMQKLEFALSAMAADDRLLYELRYRQELSIVELARHLALNSNACRVRLHRLRARLAAAVGVPDTIEEDV